MATSKHRKGFKKKQNSNRNKFEQNRKLASHKAEKALEVLIETARKQKIESEKIKNELASTQSNIFSNGIVENTLVTTNSEY